MKLRLTIALLLSCLIGAAQTAIPPDKIPFQSGEKLTYAVSYKAKIVPNSDVAEVVVSTTNSRLDGKDVLHVYGRGRVLPFFRWFFDLTDTYNCWMDASTLQPLKFTSDLKEGNYRFASTILYDWDKMEAQSRYRNLKRTTTKSKTLPLTNGSYDAVALFFNLRTMPVESFVVGQPRTMQLVLEDTVRTLNYKYVGREVKNIRGMGKFRTLKFSCLMVTSSGESFEDGTELVIWISDDRNKVPLYIETPIKVGSIQGTLSKYENLKYPLDSRIK